MLSLIAQAWIGLKKVLRQLIMPERIAIPNQTASDEKSDLCCQNLLS